jgi:formate hydrogenlyase subunit 6/NADH:ubiquinone oxidoreductase subunit I
MVMQRSYWGNIKQAVASLGLGMRLTFRHLVNIRKRGNAAVKHNIQHPDYFHNQTGVATVQYPHEQLPIPDSGRYQLHNEIDDCIVCDKCVKVCPVNCITIEPIRSPDEFGKTSDGTSKRIYAAKFDIDMGKCCFCGLCTTVCPTECLTMTPTFDFSTYDMAEHNFQFGNMTEAEIEVRKQEWIDYQAKKQAAAASTNTTTTPTAAPKPVMKPKINIPKPPPQA